MNSKIAARRLLFLVLVLSMLIVPASSKAAVDQPILRIVVVDVKGDADAYINQVKRGKPVLKRLGVEGEIHVWQATYAGKDTGMVIVTFEFANQAAFARSEVAFAKAPGDREYDAWVKDLQNVRKIISDSLFNELDTHVDLKK